MPENQPNRVFELMRLLNWCELQGFAETARGLRAQLRAELAPCIAVDLGGVSNT